MAWIDFSSNFALTPATLKQWLQNLLSNLASGGVLIFDVRTVTGWQISFFRQVVTTFSTPNFQRVWINLPDHEQKLITFDIFIRTRQLVRPDALCFEHLLGRLDGSTTVR